ncbi:MAG: hypothetical protein LBP67_07660 [Bacteroidales bacterium]|jgi:hypothetical protein|nr:hypothetical protein [Bacteroidales bacterium]
MKFRSVFLLILVSVIFSSCNKQKVYFSQTHTFNHGIWPRFEHVIFDVPIPPSKNLDMVLEITHDQSINFNILPLHVIMTNEDGEERIREFQIRLKDAHEFRGEIQDDGMIVYKHVIRSNFSTPAQTTYNVDIECFYPKYEIPCIYALTLKLVKASNADKKDNM